MKLSEWVDRMTLTGDTRQRVLTRLRAILIEQGTPISMPTLNSLDRGASLRRYPLAQAVERATDGAVTVKDLCEQ